VGVSQPGALALVVLPVLGEVDCVQGASSVAAR
jgi:hypothetical protein